MKTNDILLAQDVYSNMYWFLQVVKATDQTVTVRRIKANRTNGMPLANEFREGLFGHPMAKRVKNGRIRLGDWASAELWNGEPLHEEHPNWGLNYNLY